MPMDRKRRTDFLEGASELRTACFQAGGIETSACLAISGLLGHHSTNLLPKIFEKARMGVRKEQHPKTSGRNVDEDYDGSFNLEPRNVCYRDSVPRACFVSIFHQDRGLFVPISVKIVFECFDNFGTAG